MRHLECLCACSVTMELKWKISGNAMEVKWPETATVKMVPVLLMIFLTVSTTCTVDGQGS